MVWIVACRRTDERRSRTAIIERGRARPEICREIRRLIRSRRTVARGFCSPNKLLDVVARPPGWTVEVTGEMGQRAFGIVPKCIEIGPASGGDTPWTTLIHPDHSLVEYAVDLEELSGSAYSSHTPTLSLSFSTADVIQSQRNLGDNSTLVTLWFNLRHSTGIKAVQYSPSG
jgi:hypothetical protein